VTLAFLVYTRASLMRRLWILALAFGVAGCASSEGQSLDLGQDVTPDARRPRDRPYPCPHLQPMPRTICSTNELSCGYDGGTCVCVADPAGGFGALTWICDFGPAAEGCPETPPQRGTACTSLFGSPECDYDRLRCHCATETQVWACWNPTDCERRAPDDASECAMVGMACEYADAGCECFTDGWRCD
jgi:hypothetical protein